MKLFIPGPVDVRAEVLEQLSSPLISHRGDEISKLHINIISKLKQIMHTENDIVISSSSGTGSMEMALRSLTLNKALIVSNGSFGDRFYEIAKYNHIDADLHRFNDGSPVDSNILESLLKTNLYDTLTITHNETSTSVMNNLNELSHIWKRYPELVVILDTVSSLGGTKIDVDLHGIDACVSASQKALGLPPGLSFISLSGKAIKRMNQIGYKGYYLDLKRVFEMSKSKHQYPSTPTISIMYALDFQLNYILNIEGLENRFHRHLELASYVRNWASKYFELLVEDGYRSNTVTTIKNVKHLDMDFLKKELANKGYLFSNGYGKLKSETFRIAHMGDRTIEELKQYLNLIEEIWQLY